MCIHSQNFPFLLANVKTFFLPCMPNKMIMSKRFSKPGIPHVIEILVTNSTRCILQVVHVRKIRRVTILTKWTHYRGRGLRCWLRGGASTKRSGILALMWHFWWHFHLVTCQIFVKMRPNWCELWWMSWTTTVA